MCETVLSDIQRNTSSSNTDSSIGRLCNNMDGFVIDDNIDSTVADDATCPTLQEEQVEVSGRVRFREHNHQQKQRPNHPACSPFARRPTLPSEIKINHMKAPKDALKAVYSAGQYKAALTLDVLMTQSFMAGIYIALAGNLYLSVGGGLLGASMFPAGLLAVLLTSGELFTGDALIFVASLLGGRVSVRNLLRNWSVSWVCNFAGCVAWAAFMSYFSNQLVDVGQADLAVQVATKKAFQPWYCIFLKGIGANFMVCLGVWQYTCAEEVAGKVLALWFPIAGFVMMGFDHCIANQYFIPVGMMLGADVSIVQLLFMALLPATLGNLVGGGVFIGAIYWYVFDSMETGNLMRERIQSRWRLLSQRMSLSRRSTTSQPTTTTAPATTAVSPSRTEAPKDTTTVDV